MSHTENNHHGIPFFDGNPSEYPAWFNKIENFLYIKKCWLPLNSAKTRANEEIRHLGYAYIMQYCERNYGLTIKLDTPCSVTLLTKLNETFQAKTTVNKVRILTDALASRFSPGDCLRSHINNLKAAYQNLKYHGNISIESLPAINLMISLPNDFDAILAPFLRKPENELDFDDIALAITEEETRRNLNKSHVANFTAKKREFKASEKSTSDDKKGKRCTFCQKKGHLRADCFTLKRELNKQREVVEKAPNKKNHANYGRENSQEPERDDKDHSMFSVPAEYFNYFTQYVPPFSAASQIPLKRKANDHQTPLDDLRGKITGKREQTESSYRVNVNRAGEQISNTRSNNFFVASQSPQTQKQNCSVTTQMIQPLKPIAMKHTSSEFRREQKSRHSLSNTFTSSAAFSTRSNCHRSNSIPYEVPSWKNLFKYPKGQVNIPEPVFKAVTASQAVANHQMKSVISVPKMRTPRTDTSIGRGNVVNKCPSAAARKLYDDIKRPDKSDLEKIKITSRERTSKSKDKSILNKSAEKKPKTVAVEITTAESNAEMDQDCILLVDEIDSFINDFDETAEEKKNKSYENYLNCFNCSGEKLSGWVLDSGATIHMTYDKSLFINFSAQKGGKIRIADGSFINVEGVGTIKVFVKTKENPLQIVLKDVKFVPTVQANLLSVNRLTNDGYSILFNKDSANIKIQNDFFTLANFFKGSYIVTEDDRPQAFLCIDEWHKLLAHRNLRDIKRQQSFGLKITKCNCNHECESCKLGKLCELPYPKMSEKPARPLDIISADICGPLQSTPQHQRYFLTITDHHTDYTEVKYMKEKSEAKQHIKNFIEFCKNQLHDKPKTFRTDRGTEFLDSVLKTYLDAEGIKIEYTTPYSAQQNGVAERKNRTLNDATRTMIISSGLPKNLWSEAMKNAVYTFNRLARKGQTAAPIELFFKKKAKGIFLEFGTEVYVMTRKHERSKYDPHGKVVRFLSIDDHSKGFRLWDGNKIVIDRNVVTKTKINLKYEPPLTNIKLKDISTTSSNPHSVIETEHQQPPVMTPQNTLRRSNRIAAQHQALVSDIQQEDPKSYKEAINSMHKSEWLNAMNEEYKSLHNTKTIEIVDKPKDKKLVGSLWVFKRKEEITGVRFKARLVAQGFTQKYGQDFDQTFAPVARSATIRMLLSTAGIRGMSVKQFDVETAFLNGELKEELYMKMPKGMEQDNKVLRLRKSIYGLKQAAKAWNDKLNETLMEIGFIQSKSDDCLYILKQGLNRCYLVCHVDDMIIAATQKSIIKQVFDKLTNKFTMKDLGDVSHFLGVEINKTAEGHFMINQRKYIEKIGEVFQVDKAKPQKFPIDPNFYNLDRGSPLTTNNEYRKIIGKLLYLSTNTRPDISASVCILAQRVEKPHETDLFEALRIVKYLNGTKQFQLYLSDPNRPKGIIAYSDSNWGEDKIDGKSNSGSICFINGGPITWRCKKQTNVAISTCEAEYYAATETAKEVLWLRKLMEDFEIQQDKTIPILVDNQSCISLIETGDFKQRTKYIGVKYHFLRDHVQKGNFILQYVPTEINTADMLTKPLNSTKIAFMREAAGLHD